MKKTVENNQVVEPQNTGNKELEQNNSNMSKVKPKPPIMKERKRVCLKIILFLSLIFVVIYLLFSGLGRVLGVNNFWAVASDFVLAPREKIKQDSGKTNLLILGKSGEGYTAPDLTDTIIFTSVNLDSSQTKLVSIPRDIWVAPIRAKINSAYYWGKQKDEGFSLVKTSVEDIVGEKINYVVVIDFSAFTKAIDVVGGIDVEVKNSFTDEKYPIAGKENDLCEGDRTYSCRYETITFEKGIQHMDGATALKFVRSRNSEGDEGTDLAREQRQQQIIIALKDKILAPWTFLSPRRFLDLWNLAKVSIETDLDTNAFAVLSNSLVKAANNIKTEAIPEEILTHPPLSSKYDFQYVFVSSSGNWEKLHEWVNTLLN